MCNKVAVKGRMFFFDILFFLQKGFMYFQHINTGLRVPFVVARTQVILGMKILLVNLIYVHTCLRTHKYFVTNIGVLLMLQNLALVLILTAERFL